MYHLIQDDDSCAFSQEVWSRALMRMGLQQLVPHPNVDTIRWWLESRKRVPKEAWPGFNSMVLLISWLLWKKTNARTFEDYIINGDVNGLDFFRKVTSGCKRNTST